jgi:hypothetical protein
MGGAGGAGGRERGRGGRGAHACVHAPFDLPPIAYNANQLLLLLLAPSRKPLLAAGTGNAQRTADWGCWLLVAVTSSQPAVCSGGGLSFASPAAWR